MRIGLVLPKPPGYSETFFNSKIKGLQKAGHEVTLFVQSNPENYDQCSVVCSPKVHNSLIKQFFMTILVGFRFLGTINHIVKFIKLEIQADRSSIQIYKNCYTNAHLLSAKLDWVHFGFATMALQSEHVAKAIGSKLAISLRGFDIAIYPLKHRGCYNLLWKHVDKVHTISDDLLQLAYSHGLNTTTAFKKITPAIDINKFSLKDVKFPLSDYDFRILTVARLHWKKGLLDTLEALAILKEKGFKFSYKIIGEGKEHESLSFAIHQLGLSEYVALLGRNSHEEVKTAMVNSDMYLQYSISEGFCNAVLEAQAMQLLCIVSDAEGLSENVLDTVTGFVVPKGQPKALSIKIEEVMNLHSSDANLIRLNARERVVQNFNLEQQQQLFKAFYD